jgi:hypothetical protein
MARAPRIGVPVVALIVAPAATSGSTIPTTAPALIIPHGRTDGDARGANRGWWLGTVLTECRQGVGPVVIVIIGIGRDVGCRSRRIAAVYADGLRRKRALNRPLANENVEKSTNAQQRNDDEQNANPVAHGRLARLRLKEGLLLIRRLLGWLLLYFGWIATHRDRVSLCVYHAPVCATRQLHPRERRPVADFNIVKTLFDPGLTWISPPFVLAQIMDDTKGADAFLYTLHTYKIHGR